MVPTYGTLSQNLLNHVAPFTHLRPKLKRCYYQNTQGRISVSTLHSLSCHLFFHSNHYHYRHHHYHYHHHHHHHHLHQHHHPLLHHHHRHFYFQLPFRFCLINVFIYFMSFVWGCRIIKQSAYIDSPSSANNFIMFYNVWGNLVFMTVYHFVF